MYNTHRSFAAGIRDITAILVWRNYSDTSSGAALEKMIFVSGSYLLEAAQAKACSFLRHVKALYIFELGIGSIGVLIWGSKISKPHEKMMDLLAFLLILHMEMLHLLVLSSSVVQLLKHHHPPLLISRAVLEYKPVT